MMADAVVGAGAFLSDGVGPLRFGAVFFVRAQWQWQPRDVLSAIGAASISERMSPICWSQLNRVP